MKRHSGLFEKIYDFSNLERAYRKARRGKRYRNEVLRFTKNLEENLVNIQNHLIWKTYTQGEQRVFMIREPKARTISAVPFRDRVVQHAVNNIIEPIFDKRFFAHSYACRKDKGTHSASAQLSRWVRNLTFEEKPLYALKADIHSYFKSIDHGRLKAIIRRVIKDAAALWLIDLIIDSGDASGRGIPVGNLTSQLFANIYLDTLDKFIKEELRVRHYIRYMDDFVILSDDKKELQRILEAVEAFLRDKLDLSLNPKTTILNAKNGVDFCGYRHFYDHKKVRRRSIRNMCRTVKAWRAGKIDPERFEKSYRSWQGHIQHADSYGLRRRMAERIKGDPE